MLRFCLDSTWRRVWSGEYLALHSDRTMLPAQATAAPWPDPSALYVHVPFCPYKCAYCDFVTHVGGTNLVQPYVDAVCREIERSSHIHPSLPLRSIYLGGGTPGMLMPRQVAQVLSTASDAFGFDAECEITLESNPDTVELAALVGFRKARVNRLSLGVQSLDRGELHVLGRGHDPATVVTATKYAREAGFLNLSLDLIYGVPGQSLESWRQTLEGVLALRPEHISLYSLIVEPRTTFDLLRRRGRLALPEDDLVADMYDVASELLRTAGFEHYEVANWALPGFQCRHNLAYWHDHQFLAVGVGAFDYIRPYRSSRVRGTKRYVDLVNGHASVISHKDEITPAIERFETAVMGLRLLDEGVSRDRFRSRFPEGLDATYGTVISELAALGFLTDDGETIRMRESMVPLANEAWERFLPA